MPPSSETAGKPLTVKLGRPSHACSSQVRLFRSTCGGVHAGAGSAVGAAEATGAAETAGAGAGSAVGAETATTGTGVLSQAERRARATAERIVRFMVGGERTAEQTHFQAPRQVGDRATPHPLSSTPAR